MRRLGKVPFHVYRPDVTKADLVADLIQKLEMQITTLKSALKDSSESASGDETKSEGKYDTRAIEASYLAQAQAEQVDLAEESLGKLKRFEVPDYQYDDQIGPGALVEVDQEGEICFYFLAPTGGGLTSEFLGCEVTVITPESALYQKINEQKIGARLDEPALTVTGVE